MQRYPHRVLTSCLLALCLALAPAAQAIVTVLDPGGQPVVHKTVTITLPGQEPKEAETDDDGILFWLDGSKVDELPPGTIISDGYSFEVTTGMSTTTKVLIGVGVAAGIGAAIALSDDDGGNGGGGTPTEPDPDPPPTTPGPAMLSVDPLSLSATRTVGDPCPLDLGSVTVGNTGESSLDYTVTPAASTVENFSYPDGGGTLAQGSQDSLDFDFDCTPATDQPGTETHSVTIDAGDAGTQSVSLSVTTDAAPTEPPALANDGPSSYTKIHTVSVSPCPDPYGPLRISNTGGAPLEWSIPDSPDFVTVGASSGTLAPGETVEIPLDFPCSGFVMGTNMGEIAVWSNALDDPGMDTGTVTVTIELTVQDP
ncbi:hypothetical protein E4634_04870 [Mangrovimicrobium sediminis]|uniref:Choice-of-anchor D domain-containing protein n=1 Tax=Mangrovimicrobium sediminis TaxID=2562682 RepID=A0A4Z0M7F4_9GAMM|nr:hypothetical protein [Haliea sp. SAOS-164]TGD75327.1 hypothetical protein E4634_04870 [Haliea sp. SAOS-164]